MEQSAHKKKLNKTNIIAEKQKNHQLEQSRNSWHTGSNKTRTKNKNDSLRKHILNTHIK